MSGALYEEPNDHDEARDLAAVYFGLYESGGGKFRVRLSVLSVSYLVAVPIPKRGADFID